MIFKGFCVVQYLNISLLFIAECIKLKSLGCSSVIYPELKYRHKYNTSWSTRPRVYILIHSYSRPLPARGIKRFQLKCLALLLELQNFYNFLVPMGFLKNPVILIQLFDQLKRTSICTYVSEELYSMYRIGHYQSTHKYIFHNLTDK